MKPVLGVLWFALFASGLPAFGQNQQTTTPNGTTNAPVTRTQGRSPGGDVGSGAGDIGKGTGKGVSKAAEGTGKGAVDVVTLHPINGAGEVGKGAVVGGKDVGVGAAKGTGKIVKGTGRGIKKIF